MKKSGFGLVDMLIGLIILTAVFILGMQTFRATNTLKLNGSSDTKSIQEHIDEQVNDIESLRLENIKLQQEIIKE